MCVRLVVAASLTACLMGCPNPGVTDACDGGGECGAGSLAPRLYVSPPFGLGFDCITVGCDATSTMRMQNRGGGQVTITRALLTTTSSSDFEVVLPQTLPVSLGPQDELSVAVHYKPTDALPDEGAVRISYSLSPAAGPDPEPVSMALRTRSLGTPKAQVTQEELNFGYVEPGLSATQELTIENVSLTGSVLAITDTELEDGSDPAFTVLTDLPVFVNSMESQIIRVRMSVPLDLASLRVFRGVLHLQTNDGAHPDIPVGLIGTGRTDPSLLVDLPSNVLNVGSMAVGGNPLSVTVRIRNVGGDQLRVEPRLVTAGGAGFSTVPSAGLLPALGPFAWGQLTVNFTATRGGVATATNGDVPYLSLLSNDPDRPDVRIRLEAFGVLPNASTNPNRLDLGPVVVGWPVEPRTLNVYNTGQGPLHVSEIYMQPGSNAQLSVDQVSGLPITLLPEDPPIAVSVHYSPAVLGYATGNLVVHSDDPDQPLKLVPLSGTAVSCQEGCPLPHAVPSCALGKCTIASCNTGWHDTDGQDLSGCECGEDADGEVGTVCNFGAVNLGTFKDEDGREIHRSGTLHNGSDEDVFWLFAEDSGALSELFGDSFDLRIDLQGTPAGVEMCLRQADHDVQGQGCGRGTEACGYRNFRKDGSWGSEDGRDVTVRIRFTPGTAPFCAAYTLRVKNG